MIYNTNDLKDKVFTETDVKDIAQSFIFNVQMDDELDVIFTKTTVQNGIEQILGMGNFKRSAFKPDIETIKDFQAKKPALKQSYIFTDNEFYYKTQFNLAKGIVKTFASEAKRSEMKAKLVEALLASLKRDTLVEKLITLATSSINKYSDTKVSDTDRSDIVLTQPFDVDKVLSVDMDFTDKDKIIQAVKEIKLHLRKYKTPKKHTKFAQDNPDMIEVRTFKVGDFYLVWNSKVLEEINVATANQYHNTDLLVKGVKKAIDYDFDDFYGDFKMDKSSGTTSTNVKDGATRTKVTKDDLKNLICYGIHKDALKWIMPASMSLSQIGLTKFILHLEVLSQFGIGRLFQFPIFKVVNTYTPSK